MKPIREMNDAELQTEIKTGRKGSLRRNLALQEAGRRVAYEVAQLSAGRPVAGVSYWVDARKSGVAQLHAGAHIRHLTGTDGAYIAKAQREIGIPSAGYWMVPGLTQD
jgi:hypothetical protein